MDVVTQHSRRSLSADFSRLTNGIRKRSARQHRQHHKDLSHTDPEPAARLAHIPSRSRLVQGNLLLPLRLRGESPPPSMSSNPLAVEGVFLSKAMSFASNRPSLFPGLPRCALQAWLELEPRLLRTTAATTTIARPSGARGLHHVSWPLPVQPSRPTHHIERHPKFHHSTADLQSVSCTLRDRDVLTIWT